VKMRSDHRKAKNGNGGKSTEVSDEDAALLKVRADGSERSARTGASPDGGLHHR
jgi:hypothetical protein